MDIMLVGGASPMMTRLSSKLYKEGHKIYVLSGNRNPSERYDHVFERYAFPYSADSVKEVFRSVNPDVTVVLGAFDSNLYNEDSRKEAVEYAAGLQNVLLSWASLNKGRLVYLSSVEVYGDSYLFPVTEEVKPIPSGMRSMLLLQAEESCRFYQERLERDVIILRLDRIYDIPKDKNEAALGICQSKCLDAFREGTVTYKKNDSYGLTYMGDAVESIYKVIACDTHQYGLYHISSGVEYTELQIVDAIDRVFKNGIEKIDNTSDKDHTVVLANDRFKEEFGFDIRLQPDEAVQKTLRYMSKHSGNFLDDSHPGFSLGRRIYYKLMRFLGAWFPYIENLILFIPFFMLNNRATDSQYFSKIDFYLIFVLLFAVVHGQRQATFSALLASAGYLFRQMYEKSGFDVVTDYNTYVWIAEIFIVGLVVGYLKDRLNFVKEEKEQEEDFLTEQVTDIININDSNLRVKEGLITQVVNYDYSLGTVYDMINQLGEDHPIKILFRALTLVKQVTDCNDVSIYLVDGTTARLFGYTSEKAASMGYSVNLPERASLYDAMTKNIVYLNRNMDADYPMMAYAVCEEDTPDLMIMLWHIPFERMTINESNRLIVLGKLIRKSAKRAEAYLALLQNRRYCDGGRVLKADAFAELIDAYREAEEQNKIKYALLKVLSVEVNAQSTEAEVDENMVVEEPVVEEPVGKEFSIEKALCEAVYSTDYIGYGHDGELYILLPGTGREERDCIINRLSEKGIQTEICKEPQI